MSKRKPPATRKLVDQAAVEIKRLWGDMEVVDATKDLRVFLQFEDLEDATCGDPKDCVFARACKRTFNAEKILFYRTVAYLDLPDKTGRRRVERFEMSAEMRRIVERFDRGKGEIPLGGFVLKAPRPSARLDSRLTKQRKQAKADERKKLNGITVRKGNQGIGRFSGKPLVKDLLRSGSGLVHFTPVNEEKNI